MSLREIQTEFTAGIFGHSENHSPPIASRIVADRISAEERLAIYRNNVFSNLRGALRDSYPVIFRLLGEKFFNHAADEYGRAHPSVSGDLQDFGSDFCAFLATFEPCAELPYLPDVARLEWAWDMAFNAAGSAPLALTRIESVPPEHYAGLHFSLHPSCTLLVSNYPILRIWQVNQADYAGDQQVDLSEGGVRLAVTRGNDFAVSILPLTVGEFAFLQAVADGSNLEAALERALESALGSASGFDLGVAIRHFISHEIIVDFKLGGR